MPVDARQRAFPQGKTPTTLVDGAFPQGKTPTTLVDGAFPQGKTRTTLVDGAFPQGKTRMTLVDGAFPQGKTPTTLVDEHFYVMVNDELLMMNGGAVLYGLSRLRETQIRVPIRTIIEPKKIRRQIAHGSAPGWMELRGKGALRAAYSSFPQRRSSARRRLAYPPPGRL